jgi:hypothetical protein
VWNVAGRAMYIGTALYQGRELGGGQVRSVDGWDGWMRRKVEEEVGCWWALAIALAPGSLRQGRVWPGMGHGCSALVPNPAVLVDMSGRAEAGTCSVLGMSTCRCSHGTLT